MKMGIVDVNFAHVGAMLAQAGDDEQTEFFKAFVKECKSWGTAYQIEMQLAGVNSKLTKEEKQTLGMIGYEEA